MGSHSRLRSLGRARASLGNQLRAAVTVTTAKETIRSNSSSPNQKLGGSLPAPRSFASRRGRSTENQPSLKQITPGSGKRQCGIMRTTRQREVERDDAIN